MGDDTEASKPALVALRCTVCRWLNRSGIYLFGLADIVAREGHFSKVNKAPPTPTKKQWVGGFLLFLNSLELALGPLASIMLDKEYFEPRLNSDPMVRAIVALKTCYTVGLGMWYFKSGRYPCDATSSTSIMYSGLLSLVYNVFTCSGLSWGPQAATQLAAAMTLCLSPDVGRRSIKPVMAICRAFTGSFLICGLASVYKRPQEPFWFQLVLPATTLIFLANLVCALKFRLLSGKIQIASLFAGNAAVRESSQLSFSANEGLAQVETTLQSLQDLREELGAASQSDLEDQIDGIVRKVEELRRPLQNSLASSTRRADRDRRLEREIAGTARPPHLLRGMGQRSFRTPRRLSFSTNPKSPSTHSYAAKYTDAQAQKKLGLRKSSDLQASSNLTLPDDDQGTEEDESTGLYPMMLPEIEAVDAVRPFSDLGLQSTTTASTACLEDNDGRLPALLRRDIYSHRSTASMEDSYQRRLSEASAASWASPVRRASAVPLSSYSSHGLGYEDPAEMRPAVESVGDWAEHHRKEHYWHSNEPPANRSQKKSHSEEDDPLVPLEGLKKDLREPQQHDHKEGPVFYTGVRRRKPLNKGEIPLANTNRSVQSSEEEFHFDAGKVPEEEDTDLYHQLAVKRQRGARESNSQQSPALGRCEEEPAAFFSVEELNISQDESQYLRSMMIDWNFGPGGLFRRLEDTRLPAVFRSNPLVTLFSEAVQMFYIVEELGLDLNTMVRYMNRIEQKYMPSHIVQYHNSLHATDVLQATCCMLHIDEVQKSLVDPDMSIFAALFSAAIHDVAHPGRNEAFHVKTQSELSILYSDRSILEHHHLAVAFSTLRVCPTLNFLDVLNNSQVNQFRSTVIEMVLNTDMACHMDNVVGLRDLVNSSRPLSRAGGDPSLVEARRNKDNHPGGNNARNGAENEELIAERNADSRLLLCTIVHVCDIGNVAKDWDVYKNWIPRIFEEFFSQGDEEQSLGLEVGRPYDRTKCFPCEMQSYFIDLFAVEPMELLGTWCPAIAEKLVPNLEANKTMLAKYHDVKIDQMWQDESVEGKLVKQVEDEDSSKDLMANLSSGE